MYLLELFSYRCQPGIGNKIIHSLTAFKKHYDRSLGHSISVFVLFISNKSISVLLTTLQLVHGFPAWEIVYFCISVFWPITLLTTIHLPKIKAMINLIIFLGFHLHHWLVLHFQIPDRSIFHTFPSGLIIRCKLYQYYKGAQRIIKKKLWQAKISFQLFFIFFVCPLFPLRLLRNRNSHGRQTSGCFSNH